ncbi:hypothetical protein PR048_000494 [Dryococelus australis]|uniref:Uncharacterized protein n=1 Tax=Dryococelus australis TaxID=614101 RepID=A0ABQ9IET1_9NEOP|nr:hypothetical protein PR048_000494 [Dryococelus australis]
MNRTRKRVTLPRSFVRVSSVLFASSSSHFLGKWIRTSAFGALQCRVLQRPLASDESATCASLVQSQIVSVGWVAGWLIIHLALIGDRLPDMMLASAAISMTCASQHTSHNQRLNKSSRVYGFASDMLQNRWRHGRCCANPRAKHHNMDIDFPSATLLVLSIGAGTRSRTIFACRPTPKFRGEGGGDVQKARAIIRRPPTPFGRVVDSGEARPPMTPPLPLNHQRVRLWEGTSVASVVSNFHGRVLGGRPSRRRGRRACAAATRRLPVSDCAGRGLLPPVLHKERGGAWGPANCLCALSPKASSNVNAENESSPKIPEALAISQRQEMSAGKWPAPPPPGGGGGGAGLELHQRSIGRGSIVVRLLTSHQVEPGSITGGVDSGFLHVGIVPDDVAFRLFFSWIPPPPRSCNPALLRTHLHSSVQHFECLLTHARRRGIESQPVAWVRPSHGRGQARCAEFTVSILYYSDYSSSGNLFRKPRSRIARWHLRIPILKPINYTRMIVRVNEWRREIGAALNIEVLKVGEGGAS